MGHDLFFEKYKNGMRIMLLILNVQQREQIVRQNVLRAEHF